MYRWLLAPIVATYLTLPVIAQEDDEAIAVIKRAIKAHGGDVGIVKTRVGRLKGTMQGDLPRVGKVNLTFEELFDLPTRHKRVMTGEYAGKPFKVAYASVDDKGWMRKGDGEVKPFEAKPVPMEMYWNMMLYSLLDIRDKDYKLKISGNENVKGRLAVVIEVKGKDHSFHVMFDNETGYLVKSKRKMQDVLTGKQADGEVVYGDFKEVDGTYYPHSIDSRIGTSLSIRMQLSEAKFLRKIDGGEFAEPEEKP